MALYPPFDAEKAPEPPAVELSATQEIIVRLKAVQEKKHLTIPDIISMVAATGEPVSETAIRRVFRKGSEINDSFNYEHTLRPIAQALLVLDSGDDDVTQASTKAFLAINEYKDEKIAMLQKQIDAMRQQFETRCQEYETRMAFLRDQIELKDTRMDRKDQMIEKLLDQVLTCSHCPVEKK